MRAAPRMLVSRAKLHEGNRGSDRETSFTRPRSRTKSSMGARDGDLRGRSRGRIGWCARGRRSAAGPRRGLSDLALQVGDVVGGNRDELPAFLAGVIQDIDGQTSGRDIAEVDGRVFPFRHFPHLRSSPIHPTSHDLRNGTSVLGSHLRARVPVLAGLFFAPRLVVTVEGVSRRCRPNPEPESAASGADARCRFR